MSNLNLQQLVDKAGKMALHNTWGEKAYKINMEILRLDQNNCSAYTRLAKYYKLNDNVNEAKNLYLKVLDIDPENRGAINNLMEIEREQKENDAVDKIKATGELLKEGQKSMLKGKYRLAVKLYTRAYSMEPLLVNAVSLAGAYKKMGEYDRIENLYKQLIEDDDKQAEVETIKKEFKLLRLNIRDNID